MISSSFSLEKPEAFWKGLAVSGLDRLVVAIDGVTDDVYNQYRTNGRLALVMANLRRIVRYRNESSSRLRIEWQMLDLPWNRHEQDTAKNLAAEIGCDTFKLIPEATLPRRQYASQAVPRKRNCLLPYIILIVDAYNRARPCYKPDCNPGFLGNLKDSTAAEIWNNDEIASIRNRSRIRGRPGYRWGPILARGTEAPDRRQGTRPNAPLAQLAEQRLLILRSQGDMTACRWERALHFRQYGWGSFHAIIVS